MLWQLSRTPAAPWHVWDDLRRLQQELNQAFDWRLAGPRAAGYPALNVRSDKEAVTVTAEVPGVKPGEIDITVQRATLTIAGKRAPDAPGEGAVYHRQERTGGDFVRTLELPCAIDAGAVEARFQNGVLTIRLPRAPEDKPKTIAVKAA